MNDKVYKCNVLYGCKKKSIVYQNQIKQVAVVSIWERKPNKK